MDVEPGLVVHVDVVVVQEHPRISCAQARVRSLARTRRQACARMGGPRLHPELKRDLRAHLRMRRLPTARPNLGIARSSVGHDLVLGTS